MIHVFLFIVLLCVFWLEYLVHLHVRLLLVGTYSLPFYSFIPMSSLYIQWYLGTHSYFIPKLTMNARTNKYWRTKIFSCGVVSWLIQVLASPEQVWVLKHFILMKMQLAQGSMSCEADKYQRWLYSFFFLKILFIYF